MGGTKGHHKKMMDTRVLEKSCPAGDGYEAGLHSSSTPETEHGKSHLEDRIWTWVQWVLHTSLLRDGQNVESSRSFSMEAGEEKAGPLYAFFPKMRCRGQSCQNGCPSPKWMVGEQNCPKSISWKGLMEVALSPHPFGGSKGHVPQPGTVGDSQALLVGKDSPE